MATEEKVTNGNVDVWSSILSAVSNPEAFSSQELRSNIEALFNAESVGFENKKLWCTSFVCSLVNKLEAALPDFLFPAGDAETKIALNPEVYKKADKYFVALWLAAVFSVDVLEDDRTFVKGFFSIADDHLINLLRKELFLSRTAPTFNELTRTLEQSWVDILKNTQNVVDIQEQATFPKGQKREKAPGTGSLLAFIEGKPAGKLSPQRQMLSRPSTPGLSETSTIRKPRSIHTDDQVIEAWFAIAEQARDQLLLSQGRAEEVKLVLRMVKKITTWLSKLAAIISDGKFGVRGDKELERSEQLVSDIKAIKTESEPLTEKKEETPEKPTQSGLKQVEAKVLAELNSQKPSAWSWRSGETNLQSVKEASFHGSIFKILCPEKGHTEESSVSIIKSHYRFDLGNKQSLYETKGKKFGGFFSKLGVSLTKPTWNKEKLEAKKTLLVAELNR